MMILTIDPQGQVAFPDALLRHLGVKIGEKIELILMSGACAQLRAERPKGTWNDVIGLLEGKGNGKVLSIEEINDTITGFDLDDEL